MQLRHATTLAFQGGTTLRAAFLPARLSLNVGKLKTAFRTNTDIRTLSWKRVAERADNPTLNAKLLAINNGFGYLLVGGIKNTTKSRAGDIHPHSRNSLV